MTEENVFDIDSQEIKAALSEAALLMSFGKSNGAKLTFISLYRFGKIYDRIRGVERREENIYKPSSEELQSLIDQSGISFFGPMFKKSHIDRDFILESLKTVGYECKPLKNLTDLQLDMFYSRTLETGLIAADY